MTTDPIPEKTRNSSLGASIVGASIVGAGIVGASIVGAQGRGTATILGSGTSGGVPTIFNDFGACDPSNPRNHRMRVSVHLSVPITDAVANARAHANETKDDSAGFNEASLSGASLDGVSLDGARLSGVSLDTPGAVANTAPRPLYGLGESSQATDEVARQAAPSKQAFVSYLIDTSPDLRRQCQLYGIRHVDGVFYTHDHADHVHGIDDIKGFCLRQQAALPVYGDAETLASIAGRFAYAFPDRLPPSHYFRPVLQPQPLPIDTPTLLPCGNRVVPLTQTHGRWRSLGYRFGDFAYSTDANHLSDATLEQLQGIKVWIVDCLGRKPHPTHSHLAQTLEWIEQVKPERAYLTHLGIDMDYDALCAELPHGVEPAYDGCRVAVNFGR